MQVSWFQIRTHVRGSTGSVSPGGMGKHVRLDTAGSDSVDADALVAHVHGQTADESLDGVLAARVQRVVLGQTGGGGDGRHEDDGPLVLEVLVGLLGDEELRPRVGVEDVVVDLGRDLEERRKVLLARVGHDDVQAAKGLLAFLEQPDDVGDLGHVGLDGDGVGPERLDLLHHGVRLVGGLAVVDDYLGPARGKLQGDAFADSAAGTGDEGDLALQG